MGVSNVLGRNKPEFYLENVIEKNIEFPRTFLIPNKEEIEKLNKGNLIKLIFVMEKPHTNGCRAEKMWVEITSVQNGILTGILNNKPYYLKSIKAGGIITLKQRILQVYMEVNRLSTKNCLQLLPKKH
ncbi:MAG: DUF2314 domain-containing protein [Clostridiaceae bacterium]